MGQELVSRSHIQTAVRMKDWREAIRVAARPLLEDGTIQESYVDAMIQTVLDLGTYIVLMPMVALPHAKSEGRVNRDGMAVLKLKEPVLFDKKDPASQASLLLPIACTDDQGHLNMLGRVADILGDEQMVRKLLSCDDADELYAIFSQVNQMQ